MDSWIPEALPGDRRRVLGSRLIELVRPLPDNINDLLQNLDAEWLEFVRAVDNGDVGLTVPPFLSILLSRAARRDALPQVLADMKEEYGRARRRAWELLVSIKESRTIAEAQDIRRALREAAGMVNPQRSWPEFSPVRMLWRVAASAMTGAAAAQLLRTNPLVGGIVGAVHQIGAMAAGAGRELNVQQLLQLGAFDLAKKVNLTLRELPRGTQMLRPLLTDAERRSFGI